MQGRGLLAVGVCGLLLAGCGGGGKPAEETAPSPTGLLVVDSTPGGTSAVPSAAPTTSRPPAPKPKPKPVRQATAAELRRALLGTRDLGAGWTLGLDPEQDPPGNPHYRSTSAACTKAVNALYNELPPVRAGLRFVIQYPTGRRQLRVVLEELGSWPGDGASREMKDVGLTAKRCPTWNFFDQQYGVVPTRAVPMAFPGIGQEIAAYGLTTHWNGRGDTHDVLIFARSDTRRLLFEYSVPVGRALDRKELDRFLALALRRLPGWARG